jgi:hypothetical protein
MNNSEQLMRALLGRQFRRSIAEGGAHQGNIAQIRITDNELELGYDWLAHKKDSDWIFSQEKSFLTHFLVTGHNWSDKPGVLLSST